MDLGAVQILPGDSDMNIIRAMLVCSYMLIIAPYLIGGLLWRKSRILNYIVGFFAEVGIFTMIEIPYSFIYKQIPFHVICYIYISICGLLTICGLVYFVKGVRERERESESEAYDAIIRESFIGRICCILFILLVGVQLFRVIGTKEAEYSDEIAYIAEINDTVYMDRPFSKGVIDGKIRESVSPKKRYAPWLIYLSCLSVVSTVHPLFICRVIVPCLFLILFYMALYVFGMHYMNHDDGDIVKYMLLAAAIVEALWITFRYVTYPVMWGKIVLGSTLFPIVFIILQQAVQSNIDIRVIITFFLIGCCAAGFSMNSSCFLTIELCLIVLSYVFWNRDRLGSSVRCCVVCEIPLLVQATLFYFTYMI